MKLECDYVFKFLGYLKLGGILESVDSVLYFVVLAVYLYWLSFCLIYIYIYIYINRILILFIVIDVFLPPKQRLMAKPDT